MKKVFGIVRLLAGLISAGLNYDSKKATGKEIASMQEHKARLLTNGFSSPQPSRLPNQRQRRKLLAQTR